MLSHTQEPLAPRAHCLYYFLAFGHAPRRGCTTHTIWYTSIHPQPMLFWWHHAVPQNSVWFKAQKFDSFFWVLRMRHRLPNLIWFSPCFRILFVGFDYANAGIDYLGRRFSAFNWFFLSDFGNENSFQLMFSNGISRFSPGWENTLSQP